MVRKLFSLFLTVAFLANSVLPSFAQGVLLSKGMAALPEAGAMVSLSAAVNPPVLRGIRVSANAPLNFEFILDPGDKVRAARALGKEDDAMKAELKATSQQLMNYFLTTLTVPDEDIWVNLSPYEKDRITPEKLGETEMGRDLLAQDYLLKQITASLLYPEGESGKKFWARVYEESQARFGTTDIPVDTFNKVWIMPEKADIYEKIDSTTGKAAAFVVASSLKVMLESDYLAMEKNNNLNGSVVEQASLTDIQKLGQDMAREVLIPLLQKEVNEGENFASLRQVYGSIILALWYKEKLKDSLLSSVYVDRNKVAGVDVEDKEVTRKIWGQYVAAFKKGAVDLVREENDPFTGEVVPRKYFVGGFNVGRRDFIKKLGAFSALVTTGLGLSILTGGCETEYNPPIPAYYLPGLTVLSKEDRETLNGHLSDYVNATNDIEKLLYQLAVKLDKQIKESGDSLEKPYSQMVFLEWQATDFFVKKLKEVKNENPGDPELDYTKWGFTNESGKLFSETVGLGARTVSFYKKRDGAPANSPWSVFVVVAVSTPTGVKHSVMPQDTDLVSVFFLKYKNVLKDLEELAAKFKSPPGTPEKISPVNFGYPNFPTALEVAGIGHVDNITELSGMTFLVPGWPSRSEEDQLAGKGPIFVVDKGVTWTFIADGDYAESVSVRDDEIVVAQKTRAGKESSAGFFESLVFKGRFLMLSTALMISSAWYGCQKEYVAALPAYYTVTLIALSPADQTALTNDITNYSGTKNDIEKKLYELAMEFNKQMMETGGALTKPNAQFNFLKWNAMHVFVERLKERNMNYSNWKMWVPDVGVSESVNIYSETVGFGNNTVEIRIIADDGEERVFNVFNVQTGFSVEGTAANPGTYLAAANPDFWGIFYPGYATIPGWTPGELFNFTKNFPDPDPDDYSPQNQLSPEDIYLAFSMTGMTPDKLQGKYLPIVAWPKGVPPQTYRGVIMGPWDKAENVKKDIQVDASQLRDGGIDLKRSSMPIQTRGESGAAIRFNIDPGMFNDLDAAPGLKGHIFEMGPLQSLPAFLGISKNEESSQKIS